MSNWRPLTSGYIKTAQWAEGTLEHAEDAPCDVWVDGSKIMVSDKEVQLPDNLRLCERVEPEPLYTAAPDLLAACEAVVAWMEDANLTEVRMWPSGSVVRDEYTMLKDAIAKAKGERDE